MHSNIFHPLCLSCANHICCSRLTLESTKEKKNKLNIKKKNQTIHQIIWPSWFGKMKIAIKCITLLLSTKCISSNSKNINKKIAIWTFWVCYCLQERLKVKWKYNYLQGRTVHSVVSGNLAEIARLIKINLVIVLVPIIESGVYLAPAVVPF